MAATKGMATVLMNYFGRKSGQTIKDFQEELKALSEPDKLWLAKLAAKELGLTQAECTFSLTD